MIDLLLIFKHFWFFTLIHLQNAFDLEVYLICIVLLSLGNALLEDVADFINKLLWIFWLLNTFALHHSNQLAPLWRLEVSLEFIIRVQTLNRYRKWSNLDCTKWPVPINASLEEATLKLQEAFLFKVRNGAIFVDLARLFFQYVDLDIGCTLVLPNFILRLIRTYFHYVLIRYFSFLRALSITIFSLSRQTVRISGLQIWSLFQHC